MAKRKKPISLTSERGAFNFHEDKITYDCIDDHQVTRECGGFIWVNEWKDDEDIECAQDLLSSITPPEDGCGEWEWTNLSRYEIELNRYKKAVKKLKKYEDKFEQCIYVLEEIIDLFGQAEFQEWAKSAYPAGFKTLDGKVVKVGECLFEVTKKNTIKKYTLVGIKNNERGSCELDMRAEKGSYPMNYGMCAERMMLYSSQEIALSGVREKFQKMIDEKNKEIKELEKKMKKIK